MSPHGYKEIEHQADLALKVWAEDFDSMLQQAAEGMMVLMGVKADSNSTSEETFIIPAGNPEENLVDFLGEVLYMLEENGLALKTFRFSSGDSLIIIGVYHPVLSVERWIKAVTFHNLVLERHPDRIETTITFDV